MPLEMVSPVLDICTLTAAFSLFTLRSPPAWAPRKHHARVGDLMSMIFTIYGFFPLTSSR